MKGLINAPCHPERSERSLFVLSLEIPRTLGMTKRELNDKDDAKWQEIRNGHLRRFVTQSAAKGLFLYCFWRFLPEVSGPAAILGMTSKMQIGKKAKANVARLCSLSSRV